MRGISTSEIFDTLVTEYEEKLKTNQTGQRGSRD